MPLTYKNLLKYRDRLLTSLGGVAFAVILILIMTGVYIGTIGQVTTYIDHTPADLWVMSSGVSQMFRSVSLVPASVGPALTHVDGVASVTPILGAPGSFDRNGETTAFYLVGFDPAAAVGGPWSVTGSRQLASHQAILDRVLASKNGVRLGDTVDLMGEPFTVVGLSDQTAAVGNFYAFVRLDDADRLLRSQGRVSYFLVSTAPNANVAAVRQRIAAQVPDVAVLTKAQFAENSRNIVISMIGRPLYVMIAIGILVGVALMALTVLSVTTEQTRDYGVVKAVGASNRQLFGIVIQQALTVGVLGYIIGAVLAYGAQYPLRARLGDVNVEIALPLLGAVFALSLVMALLATALPLRRVAAVDPAILFRR